MSYYNRELVVYFIKYKLSQRNYPCNHIGLTEDVNGTEGGQAEEASAEGAAELETPTAVVNGAVNGTGSAGTPPQSPTLSPRRQVNGGASLEAVKEALRDSANEFELRYARAFSDLSSQLHITPVTVYQSFESVMDEVFRDGVNWGRIVGLFAFGGALCVECVEKEMSPLVARIAEWMTVYLDNHIQPWIQEQGGWERFAEIFGKDAAAESRRSQESFKKWLLAGMTLFTGVVLGSFIAQKRL
ncbi:bcl-2-like protein 1 [Ictalurus punctatus]|uniref:Bcl-2-like protein 1 n=1 Tax=Ictalurus punctatus TaxID=7998 RepID=W5U9J4_ICTPU|nr:bcl-2-like protein 1 [Ictalurus punctatus]XP_017342488.1 bcl-2-like protein 1 [Ictalurus punctatus]XP_053542495.1 bcl-2-like protein 1 [Ictalurus punctatus]